MVPPVSGCKRIADSKLTVEQIADKINQDFVDDFKSISNDDNTLTWILVFRITESGGNKRIEVSLFFNLLPCQRVTELQIV